MGHTRELPLAAEEPVLDPGRETSISFSGGFLESPLNFFNGGDRGGLIEQL